MLGGNQWQRSIGRPALDGKDLLHGLPGSRIGCKAVERFGWICDHASAVKRANGRLQIIRPERIRIDRPVEACSECTSSGTLRRMPRSPAGLFAAGVAVSIWPRTGGAGTARAPSPQNLPASRSTRTLRRSSGKTAQRVIVPISSAPFSLVTFNEVRPRAREIAPRSQEPPDAAVEARARPRRFCRRSQTHRRTNRPHRSMDRRRQPRRAFTRLARTPGLDTRLVPRGARSHRHDARAVRARTAARRRLPQLRDSDSIEHAALRASIGISSGQLQSGASRKHQDRSHTVLQAVG